MGGGNWDLTINADDYVGLTRAFMLRTKNDLDLYNSGENSRVDHWIYINVIPAG